VVRSHFPDDFIWDAGRRDAFVPKKEVTSLEPDSLEVTSLVKMSRPLVGNVYCADRGCSSTCGLFVVCRYFHFTMVLIDMPARLISVTILPSLVHNLHPNRAILPT
jgi:hypothetical protein